MNSIEYRLVNLYTDVYIEKVIRECSFYYAIKWNSFFKATHDFFEEINDEDHKYDRNAHYITHYKYFYNVTNRLRDDTSEFYTNTDGINHGTIFDKSFIEFSIDIYNNVAKKINLPEISDFESCPTACNQSSHHEYCTEVISTREGVNTLIAMTYLVIWKNAVGRSLGVLNSEPKKRSNFPLNFYTGIIDSLKDRKLMLVFSNMILEYFQTILTHRIQATTALSNGNVNSYSEALDKITEFIAEKNIKTLTLSEYFNFIRENHSHGKKIELYCLNELHNNVIPFCKYILEQYYTDKNIAYRKHILNLEMDTIQKYVQKFNNERIKSPISQEHMKIAIGIAYVIHIYLNETNLYVLKVLEKLPELKQIHEKIEKLLRREINEIKSLAK